MQLNIYNPYKNVVVTKEYISTIEAAFKSSGYEVSYVNSLQRQKKDAGCDVLVIAVKDAIEARRKGYRKVFLWVQGIIPEESYMRNKSWLRHRVLSFIEKKQLDKA